MLSNGNLLSAAEADGFDVLMTTDQNLRYQQNLAGNWRRIKLHMSLVAEALTRAAPGALIEVSIP